MTHRTAQPCGIEPKDSAGPVTFFHHSWPPSTFRPVSSSLVVSFFLCLLYFLFFVLTFFLSLLALLIDCKVQLTYRLVHSFALFIKSLLICLCLVHDVFVCVLRRDIAIFNAQQECFLGVAQASYHGAKTTALGQPALPRWPGAPRTTGQERGWPWVIAGIGQRSHFSGFSRLQSR